MVCKRIRFINAQFLSFVPISLFLYPCIVTHCMEVIMSVPPRSLANNVFPLLGGGEDDCTFSRRYMLRLYLPSTKEHDTKRTRKQKNCFQSMTAVRLRSSSRSRSLSGQVAWVCKEIHSSFTYANQLGVCRESLW